jgi:hypothetical protein
VERLVTRLEGEKSWQAHAWLAERRLRSQFGRNEPQTIGTQNILVNLAKLPELVTQRLDTTSPPPAEEKQEQSIDV